MKLLYLDCAMGAAGDMLSAALLELVPDKEAALAAINAAGIPGVSVRAEKSEKCGIVGTHLHVEVNGQEEHEHSHRLGSFATNTATPTAPWPTFTHSLTG